MPSDTSTKSMWFIRLYRPAWDAVLWRKLSSLQVEQLGGIEPSNIYSLQKYLADGEKRVAEYKANPILAGDNDRFLQITFGRLLELLREGRADLARVDGVPEKSSVLGEDDAE